MADLEEILAYWAADREQVLRTGISEVSFDYDQGWGGTDVTPGQEPRVIVKYTVTKQVVHYTEIGELGDFISELAFYATQAKAAGL